MIEVIRDNTKETYYTKCKHCGSELQYEYSDVTMIDQSFSYIPDRRITCPVCNNVTAAELTREEDYKDSIFSFKAADNNYSFLQNCCMSPRKDLDT